jgi:hypothetical protein
MTGRNGKKRKKKRKKGRHLLDCKYKQYIGRGSYKTEIDT